MVVSALAAAPARAQWTLAADLGGAHLRQTGIQESDAATLAGTADWRGDRSAVHAGFLGARTSDNRWTGQGLAFGSIVRPIGRRAAWELLPVAGIFAETNGRSTLSDELIARIRAGSGALGIAAGGGAGTTSLGSDTHGLWLADVDAWRVVGADQLSAGLAYVDTRSTLFRQITPVPVRYGDLTAGWQHDAPSWSLGASGGVRRGWAGAPRDDSWASLDATAWVGDHVGLVLSGGRTLEDVTRGIPRTTYASVALRLSSAAHAAIGARARPVGPQLTVTVSPSGARVIVVTARDARSVDVMADFTDWQPVALAPADHGVWRIEAPVAPGLHRVAIRLDGGAWMVPGNLPRASDEFGGAVGLITVP